MEPPPFRPLYKLRLCKGYIGAVCTPWTPWTATMMGWVRQMVLDALDALDGHGQGIGQGQDQERPGRPGRPRATQQVRKRFVLGTVSGDFVDLGGDFWRFGGFERGFLRTNVNPANRPQLRTNAVGTRGVVGRNLLLPTRESYS